MDYGHICKGKRKDNNEWIEGYLVKHNERYYIYYEYADEMCQTGNYLSYKEVIPETVCRCTELKDKNGKWIFEGDILHIRTGKGWSCPAGTDIYYKVVFTEFNNEHYSCTEYIGFMAERSNGSLSSIYYTVTSYGVEVIGNIHDNSELLEVER